jgi:hypothetical protein
MFRKIALALVATAALGTAALAPTSASAWWHGGWHGGWHGWHGGWHRGYAWGWAPRFYGAYASCYTWVDTPWGPRRRLVC